MRPELTLPEEDIRQFCRKWQISRLELFGSALREDFSPSSDIDFLVTFAPESRWSLFEMVEMQEELETIVGRKVDLVSRRGIEASPNWIRRKSILESAKTYYAA